MSLSAFAGLAEGLAQGMNMRQAKKQRDEDNAREDRRLNIMAKQLQQGVGVNPASMPGTQPGQAQSGGFGIRPRNAGAVDYSGATITDLIDRAEGAGNYSTLYGHSQNGGAFDGTDVSTMTLKQAFDFSSPKGAYGQWVAGQNNGTVATPMGRYQIVGSTLRGAAKEMGLSGDAVFDAKTQDAVANHLVGQSLSGSGGMQGQMARLRSQWAGLRNVPDSVLENAITNYQGGAPMAQRPYGVRRAQ